MIKKFLILFLISVFVFAGFAFYIEFSENPKNESFTDTHTKAICNGNICRDYVVSCKNDEIVSLEPISGFVVFSEDWKDARENKELC